MNKIELKIELQFLIPPPSPLFNFLFQCHTKHTLTCPSDHISCIYPVIREFLLTTQSLFQLLLCNILPFSAFTSLSSSLPSPFLCFYLLSSSPLSRNTLTYQVFDVNNVVLFVIVPYFKDNNVNLAKC